MFNKKEKEKYVPLTGIMGNAVDYNIYVMSVKEKILYFLVGAIAGFVVGYIFYENIILSSLLAIICGCAFIPIRNKNIIEKRKNKLLLQFKDMLEALNTSLSAGANVMDAFSSALHDMEYQYSGDAMIVKELSIIQAGIINNISIEELLSDMGRRSGLEDIENFGNVFDTCYRKGGNIKDVIYNTYYIIKDKIEISEEIKTMVAAKKSEQNAMMCMPVVFVQLLKMMGTDMINLHSSKGVMAMTIAIVCFVAAFFISKRILRIKV